MGKHRALVLGLFVLLLAVDWSLADSQVNEDGKGGQDPALNDTKKGGVETSPSKDDKGSDKGIDPIVDGKENKKIGGNEGKGAGGDGVNTNDSGAQARGKGSDGEGKGEGKGEGDVNKSGSAGGKNDKVKVSDSGGMGNSEAKGGSKDKGKDVVPKDNVPKDQEGSVDQCDPSATCKIEKKFVACLRGTGHESPEFSLLVRNYGEKGLEITISGPEFVHLENKTVQVGGKDKQEVKMKVETNTGGGNNLISLQIGSETCDLNIAEFVARISEKKVDSPGKNSAATFMSNSPTIALISFAALLILASAWTCISLCRKLLSRNSSKYQRMETELPVSAIRQTEPASNDGWDNNWGDDWDDEEAPLTPSVHLTPTLSSKGLASRRLNKDGWKD